MKERLKAVTKGSRKEGGREDSDPSSVIRRRQSEDRSPGYNGVNSPLSEG